jgi:hypothetical protein
MCLALHTVDNGNSMATVGASQAMQWLSRPMCRQPWLNLGRMSDLDSQNRLACLTKNEIFDFWKLTLFPVES